jgi:two-component system OmpR family sensor kinase
MFRSIRFRLAFSYTVLVALTFLLISWAIYQYIGSSLAATLDQSIYRELDWTLARYERGRTRPEAEELTREDLFEHASYFPWKEYAEVWSDSATLFYGSPNLGDDTLARYAAMPAEGRDTMQTVAKFRGYDIRLLSRRRQGAIFLVAMPTEPVVEPLRQLLRAFEWLGPVVIVVAIGMGSFLAKRSFSKINEVVETANMITADRLHDRIPDHNAKDEIGRIVTTFNEMISRLDASFRQMKQFSADASHELRTPLSVMRTQLETALTSSAGADELKSIAANCLDEAMRMSTIIDNLLLLARADAGQELVRHEPVDLQKLVRETYDECVLLASPKSIKVTLRESQPVTILGDELRLRQMLLNLIDNAIRYNRMSGTIDLHLTRDTTFAEICIADTGIGIPENQVPRIFDRFYRVDRARSRALGSSGLGLSIAQWIVHAHGGTIGVASTVNRGSEFCVRLPLAAS